MSPRPILTAADTRAAEDALIASGTSVIDLMERAGAGAAEVVWRAAGAMPALILCGPGNNGGDGYVIARLLRGRGMPVRIAASSDPRSDAAQAARARWGGAVEQLGGQPAPLLVDCLFGTGLARPLHDGLAAQLGSAARAARLRVAVDLPSGVATDSGALLSAVPRFDVTVALGALKPAHRLDPAAGRCGHVVVADIGLDPAVCLHEIARPVLPAPTSEDHKYTRGYVAVVGGAMAGAAMLAAEAAAHAGAGYVRLLWNRFRPVSKAIVQGEAPLDDARIGAIVVGPGLGRGRDAAERLRAARASGRPLVIDGDALGLLGANPTDLGGHILTPHAGEFARMFPDSAGSKLDRARGAAKACAAVVVFKGADTVVASPDGRAAIAAAGPPWLATAGTGDVLAGIAGAMLARGLAPFEAACAAVWLHAAAARSAGPGMIADDLVAHLPLASRQCR